MINHKINIELLNFLNEAFGSMNFFQDLAEEAEIVPSEKTHKELLQNYIVSPEIYRYYNRVNLFEPFTKNKRFAYIPLPKHHYNLRVTPYNLKICNAYYYRPDLIFKLGSVFYDSPIYLNGKEIKTLSDLKPYFFNYAKGFNEGYTSFEQKKINFVDPAFTDKTDLLKKVFEFITARPTNKKHYWGKLTFTQHNFTTDKEISKDYEGGLLQGYYYKAWTIVFTQNDFFTPLFKGLEQPQQNEISDRENEFDHVDISTVYDYFNKELVKTNFLTDTQLIQYLKVAFEKTETLKNKFTFKNDPQKSVITNVFYRYYKDVAGRGRKKNYREQCASLLGEYFNGYNTKKVLNNFNK